MKFHSFAPYVVINMESQLLKIAHNYEIFGTCEKTHLLEQ